MKSTTYEYVIIGAGISGTLISYELSKIFNDKKILLINREKEAGGRTLTTINKMGELIELGAMRIPESHKQTLKLCQQINVALESFRGEFDLDNVYQFKKYYSRYEKDVKFDTRKMLIRSVAKYCNIEQGVDSNLNWLMLNMSTRMASKGIKLNEISFNEWIRIIMDKNDRELFWILTGYEHMKNKDLSFIASFLTNNNTVESKYYKPIKGMQEITKKLKKLYKENKGEINFESTVKRIDFHEQKYEVKTTDNKKVYAKNLIIAIPPSAIKNIENIEKILDKETVSEMKFIKGYSSSKTYATIKEANVIDNIAQNDGFYRTNLSIRLGHWNPCSKGIYNKKHRTILAEYKSNMKNNIETINEKWGRISNDLEKILNIKIKEQPMEIISIDWENMQSKTSAHYWGIGAQPNEILKRIQTPKNNLYFIGEAFSLEHGWVNGAVTSTMNVLETIKSTNE